MCKGIEEGQFLKPMFTSHLITRLEIRRQIKNSSKQAHLPVKDVTYNSGFSTPYLVTFPHYLIIEGVSFYSQAVSWTSCQESQVSHILIILSEKTSKFFQT
jgi:hypothetical protein